RDPVLKYMALRPRPVDHLLPGETWPPARPHFPLPEDPGGDVKNLVGTPGGNDSVWIDPGFPVKVTPDGRKYKALFAPLIIDLDNRINLSVHGNAHGRDPLQAGRRMHVSNQGWGRWEVNPARLNAPGDPRQREWINLLVGHPTLPDRGAGTANRGDGS